MISLLLYASQNGTKKVCIFTNAPLYGLEGRSGQADAPCGFTTQKDHSRLCPLEGQDRDRPRRLELPGAAVGRLGVVAEPERVPIQFVEVAVRPPFPLALGRDDPASSASS